MFRYGLLSRGTSMRSNFALPQHEGSYPDVMCTLLFILKAVKIKETYDCVSGRNKAVSGSLFTSHGYLSYIPPWHAYPLLWSKSILHALLEIFSLRPRTQSSIGIQNAGKTNPSQAPLARLFLSHGSTSRVQLVARCPDPLQPACSHGSDHGM